MNKEEFIKEIKKIGIEPNEIELNQLERYYKLLIEENKKYNLTAITEENAVYLKHFYDSLTIIKSIKLDNQYILDIGTGAGFPGIVLKIFFPNIQRDLLDSTSKKCLFLDKVIQELNLKKIKVLNCRAEEYAHEKREIYDIVTSRAVAPLKHLLEIATPLIKEEGKFVSLKGNIQEEIINIKNYYEKLFLKDENIISFNLPNNGGFRTIYQITKYNKTPLIYPRQYSQIKKKEI